ncbi:hypothetical protein [Pseudomonas sp. H3_D04]
MSFFSRFKSFMKQEPEEQIAGYSISELKTIFADPSTSEISRLPYYPKTSSLEGLGIPAFYSSFLIEHADTHKFLAFVEANFKYTSEKTFNELPAKHYVNDEKNEQLVFFTSHKGVQLNNCSNGYEQHRFHECYFAREFCPSSPMDSV